MAMVVFETHCSPNVRELKQAGIINTLRLTSKLSAKNQQVPSQSNKIYKCKFFQNFKHSTIHFNHSTTEAIHQKDYA